jgi:hypothetical protein
MNIKPSNMSAVEAFLAKKRAIDPNYGKCKAAEGKGKSVFMLERQQEQNEMMGFGPILNCDLSKKQKAAKSKVIFTTEAK